MTAAARGHVQELAAGHQVQLRAYQWIEVTRFYKDGDEKSHQQKHVYYGADGNLQKLAVEGGSSPQPSTASLPCNPDIINSNGVTYYQCGQTYYLQAYGSTADLHAGAASWPMKQAASVHHQLLKEI